MAKFKPDYSFQRDGIGLKDWLWKLLDEDRAVRLTAGEALHAMQRALPSVHTDLREIDPFPDWNEQSKRFKQRVREVVTEKEFDVDSFIRRLCAFRFAISSDWNDRVKQGRQKGTRDEKFDRISDQLVEKINSATDDAIKQHATERFARLSCNYICGGWDEESRFKDAESMLMSGLASGAVFAALSKELVAAPDALMPLLTTNRHDVLKALAETGAAGIDFAPRLLADLDALASERSEYTPNPHFDASAALASIAKGNRNLTDQVIRRLSRDTDPAVQIAAAATIERMDAEVCNRNQEVADLLRVNVDPEIVNGVFLSALASVGRHIPSVRALVIDRAKPGPAVMRAPQGFPQYPFDVTMGARGIAISAMTYFTEYSDECTATLIDAIDTFTEYDPDEESHGSLARIAFVVGAFGRRGDPMLARALAAHLADDDEEYPKAILHALASMGCNARDVLPQLESYWLKHSKKTSLDDLNGKALDEFGDLAGWVIQQIRKAI